MKHDGLKFSGTHQLLVDAAGVNVLDGNLHTVKNNTAALLVTSRETGIEESADKTTYIVVSRDQNVGRSDNMKLNNSSFERVEESKYLGTTLINQNSTQEERAD